MGSRSLLKIVSLGLFLGMGLSLPSGSAAEPLQIRPIRDPSQISEKTRAAMERRQQFPHELFSPGAKRPPLRSREDILSPILGTAQANPDTARLAIIRISFAADVISPDSTTGDGRFDLRTDTGIPVDPPPHNKTYFEAHGAALARYYRSQSYGGLEIVTTVLPEEENGSFELSDMAAYGPWRVEQSAELIARAERFVFESLQAADASGTFNFSDFDYFVIVHAGADFQGDVNRDTPYDIPAFTLTFGEPLELTTGSVDRALVLPESSSQDGLLAALNGVFAHECGHLIGRLPDLYNIFSLDSQVGFWSLMDSGDNIAAIVVDPETNEEFEARGIFPTSFDPWSKLQFFGSAAQPVEVQESYDELLTATQLDPTIPLVSIDPFEYFLVENRALDLDGNGFPFVRQDSTTGVFMGPVADPDNLEGGGDLEWDAVLPGGGVLIWHIDDRIVLPALADRGQVNLGFRRQGVAMEEADGINDFLLFTGILGRPDDLFFEGNNTEFGPNTTPSSASNAGDATGITIRIQGAPDRTMGLQVERKYAQSGWPVPVTEDTELAHGLLLDLDANGTREFLFGFADVGAKGPGLRAITGLDALGQPVDFDDQAAGINPFATSTSEFSRPLVGASSFRFNPSEKPRPAVATITRNGRVSLFGGEGAGDSGSMNFTYSALGGPVLLEAPAGQSESWIITAGLSELTTVDGQGNVIESEPALLSEFEAPTAGPVVTPEAQVRTNTGLVTVPYVGAVAYGNQLELFTPGSLVEIEEPSRAFTLDEPIVHLLGGYLESEPQPNLVAIGLTQVWVLSPEEGVIKSWALPESLAVGAQPIIADLNQDQRGEIVIPGRAGNVFVYRGNGSLLRGWPLGVGAGSPKNLMAADLDGDADLDLLVLDREGVFHGLTFGAESLPEYPRSLGPFDIVSAWMAPFDEGGMSWVATTSNATLAAMRFPDAVPHPGDWRAPGSEVSSGFFAEFSNAEPTAGADTPNSLLAYPNPARGQDVELRFSLAANETPRFTVFDVSGREIPVEIELRGDPSLGENAAVLRVDDLAPGLYVCRLEKSGANGSSTETTKVAILR